MTLKRFKTIISRLRADQRGNVLTEMALVMPVFALLAVGSFDMGRFALEYTRLEAALRAGAQVAIQNVDTVGDLTLIEAEVEREVADSIGANIATLTVIASTNCACGELGVNLTTATCNSLCDDGNVALTVLVVRAGHILDPVFSIPGFIETRRITAQTQFVVQ